MFCQHALIIQVPCVIFSTFRAAEVCLRGSMDGSKAIQTAKEAGASLAALPPQEAGKLLGGSRQALVQMLVVGVGSR
jgi:hypothetical protein